MKPGDTITLWAYVYQYDGDYAGCRGPFGSEATVEKFWQHGSTGWPDFVPNKQAIVSWEATIRSGEL